MYRRILVPIDGSRTAALGLDEAIRLARDQRARLCLLHVLDEFEIARDSGAMLYYADFLDALRKHGRKILARAEARARKQRLRVESVLFDTPEFTGRTADAIVSQARRWRADLIVLGTHGRRGVSHLVMGSDAELVVRQATVPVLLVRSSAPRRRSRRT